MKNGIVLLAIIILGSGIFLATRSNNSAPDEPTSNSQSTLTNEFLMEESVLTLTSAAFENNGTIPVKYTCDGENVNPPLAWESLAPPTTRSYALIMEDPDVPASVREDQMFDHWLLWNIPRNVTSLAEASTPPGVQGNNTRGEAVYTGPCPPDREHRYFFKLYLLKTELSLPTGSTKAELLAAMDGNVIAAAQLVGRYNRQP